MCGRQKHLMVAALKFSFFLKHFSFEMTVKVIFIKKWINHLEYTQNGNFFNKRCCFSCDWWQLYYLLSTHTHKYNQLIPHTYTHRQQNHQNILWINFVFISIFSLFSGKDKHWKFEKRRRSLQILFIFSK